MNTITGSFILALAFSAVTANPQSEWLNNVSAKLSAEEASLVRRAQATLVGNIVVAKPWAPLFEALKAGSADFLSHRNRLPSMLTSPLPEVAPARSI
jgi:hypothetical protein